MPRSGVAGLKGPSSGIGDRKAQTSDITGWTARCQLKLCSPKAPRSGFGGREVPGYDTIGLAVPKSGIAGREGPGSGIGDGKCGGPASPARRCPA